MFNVKCRNAIQPLRRVGSPAKASDSSANATTGAPPSWPVAHAMPSAPAAHRPAAPKAILVRSGKAGGGGVGRAPASSRRGAMPNSVRANSSAPVSCSRWWMVSSRSSRLKSSCTTPAMGSIFWRIRRSSVGQSI